MRTLALAALFAVAGSALAQTFTSANGPYTIPDGPAADTLGTPLTVVINVPNNFVIGSFNSVSFTELNHTWAGDLMITLTAPNGTIVDLFDRPGRTGTGNSGFSGDFLSANSYSIVEVGTTFPTTGASVPTGSYSRVPNVAGGSSSATATFSNLAGINVNGNWTLTIQDGWVGDTGGFLNWSFNVTPVPEPATMAILGLGAAALLRRRRK